ncbi:HAD family hydrolase [Haloplanus aerogenes]|uniref:HAD family hydrolase n=1 Tax=Haloplanus aerogenes TaxID=660522 RepID=A0A3M0E1Q0_9EURY|nr:HAD family hydrolase [Haloplanus aerogenes]AZH25740.1 HAD family hydrolase [Haloplanus aerogenes]RMB25473.1 putative hydrolase of the HAD superfamily [Haloplanus aerogenes]
MDTAAVAFDLDDTLAVTRVDRATLLEQALRAVGAPQRSREAYLQAHAENLTARSREPVFERLFEGEAVDATAVAQAYRDRVNAALEPVPGVEEMLATLRERYRLGLLTNGPVVAQRSKLAALGWTDAFDAALVTGELTAGKPESAAFESLLAELGTDASETVFVGNDVTADVQGAVAAGIDAVQVCYPDGPPRDPDAFAHVERDELATRLPAILDAR